MAITDNGQGDASSPWGEARWERYFQGADEEVKRYMSFYLQREKAEDRLDKVALDMGWEEDGDEDGCIDDMYTIHLNPVYIATRAIFELVNQTWIEALRKEGGRVDMFRVLEIQRDFGRAEDFASQAIHAIDFGDYQMASSLFKRALAALNLVMRRVGGLSEGGVDAITAWRARGFIFLFDLRDVWLRVMTECREEAAKPPAEEDEEEDEDDE
jgi:hypothetical protein